MEIYFEDGTNVRSNQATVIGGFGPNYNAVLPPVKFTYGSTTESALSLAIVSLADAKDWCRIDISDDDALITALIKAARIICERFANLSFIQRTVTARIHNGLGNINLPYGPVNGTVTYTNIDTTSAEGYDITVGNSIDVNASYSAGPTTLDEDLRTAWLNQIAWMYENRGDANVTGQVSPMAKLILQTVRIES